MAIGLSWIPGAMADLNEGLVAYYPISGNAEILVFGSFTRDSDNSLNRRYN